MWRLGGQGPAVRFDTTTVVDLEKRLSTGGPESLRQALDEIRPDLSEPVADYLDAVLAFAEGRPADAAVSARRAHDVAPTDWRPLSYLYAALAALDRWEEAGVLVTAAADRSADDERVLALAAHHFLRSPQRKPDWAHELLDVLEALPNRLITDDDPSAVRPDQLLSLRVDACAQTGRRDSAVRYARELATNWPLPDHEVALAEAARLAGDTDTAVRAYARAVTQVPSRLDWRRSHAQILLQIPAGRADLLATTAEMVQRWPSDRSVRVLRARALVRAGDALENGIDAADLIYQRLLAEDPDDIEVLRNRGALLYDWKQGGRDGDYLDEAHLLLRRYVRLGGVPDGPLVDIWEKLQARALRSPDPAALTAARAAFEANPSSARALATYVEALRDAGRPHEAGGPVRQALAAAPKDAAVAAVAARHFMAGGPDHDAGETLQRLVVVEEQLSLDGLPEPLLWLRCRALTEILRFAEARDDAKALLAQRPTAGHYLRAYAKALGGLREHAAAEAPLRAAVSVDPDNEAWFREYLDLLLRLPGGAAVARKRLEQRFPETPRSRSLEILHARALAGSSETQEDALSALRALVDRQPDDPEGLAGLGLALDAAGLTDDAREVLQRWSRAAGLPFGPVRDVWERLNPQPR